MGVSNIILDGEVVVEDEEQHSNFQLLQNSINEHLQTDFRYYVFDILYLDQYDLRDLPLIERKQILQRILPANHPILIFNDHVQGSGKKVLREACKLGLEGIVSKDSQCPYEERRSKTWLKTKCTQRQEFVIGGLTLPQGSRSHFGALLIGTYNKKGELEYNGKVGTGFTESSLKTLYNLAKKNITEKNPFNIKPPGYKSAVWLKPVLVCEVEFSEWTDENILRHPSFKVYAPISLQKKLLKKNLHISRILEIGKKL